jgi:hypothetical protein
MQAPSTQPKRTKFGQKKTLKKNGQSMDFFGGQSNFFGQPEKCKLVKFAM